VSRPTIFGEMTELLSSLADDPCERLDDPEREDNRTAVECPNCGGICRVCRARILLYRIDRRARVLAGQKKKKRPTSKPKPRSRARARR
jgi:hypothetical protein